MYTYMYTYIYVCIRMCVCVYVHVYVYVGYLATLGTFVWYFMYAHSLAILGHVCRSDYASGLEVCFKPCTGAGRNLAAQVRDGKPTNFGSIAR